MGLLEKMLIFFEYLALSDLNNSSKSNGNES